MSQIKPTIKIRRLHFQRRQPDAEKESWSIEYIVDELTLTLLQTKEVFCMLNSDRITTRMWDPLSLGEVQDACRIDRDGVLRPLYVEQARYKIYRMSIFRPPPAFVIYLKHLPHRIKEELANLDRQTKDYVIKEAIGRIFEHVDRRFYYISAKPILEWRLE